MKPELALALLRLMATCQLVIEDAERQMMENMNSQTDEGSGDNGDD